MTILITGISGTLGVAFTEYLKEKYNIIGIDRNEESLAKFHAKFPDVPVKSGDFVDVDLEGVDIILHLAAMKHIDLCEQNPNSCVLNNVLKTHILFKNAHLNKTSIIFMSTDKAVEPISTYGFSKALGEAMALEYGGTIIRSGNILQSSGSVLQIWDEAIQNNLPLKLTHKDMHRYFISPENLVKRAWELYLKGKRVIVPKMDKDIKLVDLANEKLAEYGWDIETYPGGVEYIGLRLGEKLKESLEWEYGNSSRRQ